MATGHLRKRTGTNGDTSYQLIVEGERDPMTGKRERHYKTVKGTKKSAEATLRKMIADVESGGIAVASAMKVEDWMEQWLRLYLPNIEATTRASYEEKTRNYIVPVLGKITLKSLKTENIQSWVNGMSAKGLSPKTIRNAFNNLNAALKKACVLRMIPYNPCEGAELPKLKRYQGEVFDTTAIADALEKAKGTDMYLIILLLAMVGLRRGELLALKWKHVDFASKTLRVEENMVLADGAIITKAPKSSAGARTVRVGDEVIVALKEAKADYFRDRTEMGAGFHDNGYIIRKKNGDSYRPDSITQKWERFLEKNGLPHIRLHDLRHSNATALIQAGVSPKVVQQRLGHADINITLNTYTHVLPSMDEEAAATLDDMILKKANTAC